MAKTYQWRRITGGTPTPISGATASTYELVEGDEGADIDCGVTNGGVTAYADAVGPVEAAGPAFRYPTLLSAPASQYAAISQSQPALATPVQFGDLETVVVRITDDSRTHEYATLQAFSADQSQVLLWGSGGGTILNTADWSVAASGVDPGAKIIFWDPVTPGVAWAHDGIGGGNRIYKCPIGGTKTTYPMAGYTQVDIGGGEGSISADGRYIVCIGQRTGGVDVFLFDTVEEAIDRVLEFDGYSGPHGDINNALVSKSGDYIVVGSEKSGDMGHIVYDRATGARLYKYETFLAHADTGWRTNGDECLVRMRTNGDMVTVRLSDGSAQAVIANAAASWHHHISCGNIHRPGWAYISMMYGSDQTSKYLFREIIAVKLDGSGQIERWGQSMFPANTGYSLQAKAVASPYGDMVLFTSGWGTTTPREYVMYVPETMP